MSNHIHSGDQHSENGTNFKTDDSHPVTHEAMDDIFSGIADSGKRTSRKKAHSHRSMKQSINQILHELEHPPKDGAAHTQSQNKNIMVMLNRPYIIVCAGLIMFISIVALLMISDNKEPEMNGTSEHIESAVHSSESHVVQKDSLKSVYADTQHEVTDKNSPPQIISADIVPVILSTGTAMEVQAGASDVEGDDIRFDYEWSINGDYAGKELRMTRPLKRGDSIRVKISPYDDVGYGLPVVLTKNVHNTPPQIIGGASDFYGSLYSYQLEAIDNDEDTLTYTLDSAPEGMIIDSSGQITWTVPPDFKGTVNITVAIDDGYGGKATQQLTFSMKESETS